ncbi:MAG: SLC13 family permease [Hyphomicrobiales bacterium]
MTFEQMFLFGLFAAVFAMLLWGKFRYDLVAFCALVLALIVGVVPYKDAFSGFGHPATVIVALVLVVSRGLINSGAIDLITRRLLAQDRPVRKHIAIVGSVGGILSAFINNVAALAILMPVDMQAAGKAKRMVAITLMPLAFATILGGMITLIGTPPNIIIAAYRETVLGTPFSMFDFAPVGIVCSIAGIAFIAFVGWRLIPIDESKQEAVDAMASLSGYVAELVVGEDSPILGQMVRDLDEAADEADVAVLGLVRNGRRLPGRARTNEIRIGDMLVLEAPPASIDKFRATMKLTFIGEEKHASAQSDGMALMEVVVPDDSRIVGRSANDIKLLYRQNTTLLGVARKGKRFRDRVRRLPIESGDVLLLLGASEHLPSVASWLGVLPLKERGLNVTQHKQAGLAVALFGAAIALASFGLLQLAVALAVVVIFYVLLKIVPISSVYEQIEWPVIVLLGSMIPLGSALEASGGTELIANGIVSVTSGYSAPVILTVLMVVTMSLSDLLNNTATAVIAAPIAVNIANTLGVSPDPFLMAVAVAASCAFLTPIGHKNNTLIMGPGGYRFGDYWRMGLPLEIIVIAVSVPTILLVWPL